MDEYTNDDRADTAVEALEAFRKATRHNPDDQDPYDELLRELLCNLQHFADREGLNFRAVLADATAIYADEVEGIEAG
jgi:hypothetical protein